VVDVSDIGTGDGAFPRCEESRLLEVFRDAVVLGEVIQCSSRDDRELSVLLCHESGGGPNGAVPTGNDNTLCSGGDRLFEPSLELGRINLLEVEAGFPDCLPRGVSAAAFCVEECLEAGSGKREAGSVKRKVG